jgi:hypothetical protein
VDLYSSFPATFAGRRVDATAVLLRYVFAGDTNFDLTVNDADYAIVQSNLGRSPARFHQGDFSYDHAVDAPTST